jgi:hypothetical protein
MRRSVSRSRCVFVFALAGDDGHRGSRWMLPQGGHETQTACLPS